METKKVFQMYELEMIFKNVCEEVVKRSKLYL